MSAGRSQPSLAHPLWVASLIVLVVNDHLLKGADLLPAVLTGKLSDFAGLLVAPAVLAWLLGEGARVRVAAHVAVGVGFAALQLFPGFAVLWDGTLTGLGLPWHTVSDPTDLIALPALLVSWAVLRPTPQPAPHAPWLGAAGLLACIATSPPEQPGTWTTVPTGAPPDGHQVALVNDGEEILEVLVRELRDDVTVDCDVFLAGEDPGALLSPDLFDVAVAWELPPRSAIAALQDPWDVKTCHAVLVDGPNLEPHVLFWEGRAPTVGLDALSTVSLVAFDDLDRGLVHPLAPRVDPECQAQSELDRLDWSAPQRGAFTLLGVTSGADGCLSLDVGESEPIFVCMPEEAFPFVVGDTVEFSQAPGQLAMAGEDADVLLARLGDGLTTVAGLEMRGELDVETCGYRVDPDCGQVTADAQLAVAEPGGLQRVVLPGGSVEVGPRTVWVTRAEVRAVTAPECLRPQGPIDLDVIVVTLPE